MYCRLPKKKTSSRGASDLLLIAKESLSQRLAKILVHIVNSTASAQSHLCSSNKDGKHFGCKLETASSSPR
jgi:hypothetical protein